MADKQLRELRELLITALLYAFLASYILDPSEDYLSSLKVGKKII